MSKEYSIAEARNSLSQIIHTVEGGKQVRLTRRGKSVAVLISEHEYQHMTGQRKGFWDALQAFRQTHELRRLGIGADVFNKTRAKDRGRNVTL